MMSARWQPGQALFAGFDGTACPAPLRELIAAGRLGGVVLFARNVESPPQLRALVRDLRACAPADAPLLVAIDQEGGRVQRLRAPWTEWPPMRRLGMLDDPVRGVRATPPGGVAATADVARALAVELRDCGIGLDFAPVVDVDSNPANPVIGDRSFGRDPAVVAAHTTAFVGAMQAAGVACCAKHFPGHGDTTLDSHLALPRIAHDLDRLLAVELPPFAAAVAAGVASVMSAHVVFEAIDPRRPATFSPDVIALLRDHLGFDGLLFSDDLEMKAVADRWRPHEMVDFALAAGVDVLLACRRFELVTELLARLESLPDALLETPLTRIAALKRHFVPPPPVDAGPPYPAHLALAARLARTG